MEIKDYLKDELKRLNRMNDMYEKNIGQGKEYNEPERIVENVKAMCEVSDTFCKLRNAGLI